MTRTRRTASLAELVALLPPSLTHISDPVTYMPNPNDDPIMGELEQMVLCSLVGLRQEACGLDVQMRLGIYAHRELSLGTVCRTLQRLERKRLARSRHSAPQPIPGGRRKRLYGVTQEGLRALARALSALLKLCSGRRGAPAPRPAPRNTILPR